jgi:transposase
VSASLLGGHMDAFTAVELPARRTRRRHEGSFKASVVAASSQPGMSLSAVSLANGLNPNMVRKRVREADTGGVLLPGSKPSAPVPATPHPPAQAAAFMPVAFASAEPLIVIEVQRPGTCVKVTWPAQAVAHCAVWIVSVRPSHLDGCGQRHRRSAAPSLDAIR